MVQGGGFENEQGFQSGSLGSGAIRDDFGPNDACGVCVVLVFRFAEGDGPAVSWVTSTERHRTVAGVRENGSL